jgi:AcrR family transcriptional regulator
MARNRFENLEPERREDILAAAGQEFAERGYGAASLSRIIEVAGISKGSLYYYFNDKEDLFVTTVEVAIQRLFDGVGGLSFDELDAASYWDSVRELGLRSMAVMCRDEWYVRLALALPRLRDDAEARAAIRPAMESIRELTRKLIERGRELGVVRRDLPLDLLVVTVMAADDAGDRWMVAHRQELDEAGLRKLMEARIDLMRDMLDASHEGWDR